MSKRYVLLTAAGILVAVLIFGSVHTTGALWRDQEDAGSDTDLATGSLELSPGTSSGSSFTFPALHGTGLTPGDARQAELVIENSGTTPLAFELASAGPTVSGTGQVTVRLSGRRGSCPAPAATDLSGAFTAGNTSTASTSFTSSSQSLVGGDSTTWCIRAKYVSGTGGTRFTIAFHFDADQVRA